MAATQLEAIHASCNDAPLSVRVETALRESGSASHPLVRRLGDGSMPLARDLIADVLHHLSLLHGNRPSVFEIVAKSPIPPSPDWLNAAMRAFVPERELLARLIVSVGEPPRRAGQTAVEQIVNSTRSAMHTLAGSDRLGCAVGAAAALLLDWDVIGGLLRRIATVRDLNPAAVHSAWPDRRETQAVILKMAGLPGGERAVMFGFQALLAQHRAFWDIVQDRAC